MGPTREGPDPGVVARRKKTHVYGPDRGPVCPVRNERASRRVDESGTPIAP